MYTLTYVTSLLTFYLRGEISFERNFIRITVPNTILGFIPLGKGTTSLPINQLSSVDTNAQLHFRAFLSGIALGIVSVLILIYGASNDYLLPIGLVLFLIAANRVLTSFETLLYVRTTSGSVKVISFFVFEKNKAFIAEAAINELINARMDDTNDRVQTDRIIEAISKLK